MTDELEAAGTAIEGGLLTKAVEDESGEARKGEKGRCLNCQSEVLGRYCTNCGQPLHVHRSIGALWHDILHGVLHFEGKFWRTIPLLAWKPGDLTRRYVRGERARFISPMALFLFSIFMMFAVFSFIGSPFSSDDVDTADVEITQTVAERADRIDKLIPEKTAQLDGLTGSERVELEAEILNLKKFQNLLANISGEDSPFPDIKLRDGDTSGLNYSDAELDQIEAGLDDLSQGKWLTDGSFISTGSAESDRWLRGIVEKVVSNPDLLTYKLKANGYKFAWLLIPISVPFVWLAMIGRRGYHFYDHAVFATYSIAFMSLLFITCAILAALGVSEAIWGSLLIFYPPIHLYRQLRHAYQLSRPEALVRVFFLFVFIIISVILFFSILLTMGVLG